MPSSLLGETGTVAVGVGDDVIAEDVGDDVVAEDVSDGVITENVVHVVLMSSTATICRSWSSVGQQWLVSDWAIR